MKPTLIFISHLGLQHIEKQKNSNKVGYMDCLYYNRMNLLKTLAFLSESNITLLNN